MKLRWTRLALADLSHAREYIAKDSAEAAARVVDRIEGAAEALARHPYMGKAGRVAGSRELVIPGTPFYLSYWIVEDSVEVLAVVHGARRWP